MFGDLFDPEKWPEDLGLEPSPPPPPPHHKAGDCYDKITEEIDEKVNDKLKDVPSFIKGTVKDASGDLIKEQLEKAGLKSCDEYKKAGCKDPKAIVGCAKTCDTCKKLAEAAKDAKAAPKE